MLNTFFRGQKVHLQIASLLQWTVKNPENFSFIARKDKEKQQMLTFKEADMQAVSQKEAANV